MTPPNSSVISPEVLGAEPEDQTTPKVSTILPAPLLQITENSEPTKSSVNSLMPPPSTTRVRPNNNNAAALSISTFPPQTRPRQKVVLAPGHSSLDWAHLKSSGTDLRVPSPTFSAHDSKPAPRIFCVFHPPNSKNIADGTMRG